MGKELLYRSVASFRTTMVEEDVVVKSSRMKWIAVLALAVVPAATAQTAPTLADLQRTWNDNIAGKQVLARVPYAAKTVALDAKGNCLKACERGGFAGDGTWKIDQVSLSDNAIEIKTHHFVTYYDVQGQRVVIEKPQKYELRVLLQASPTEEVVAGLLKTIFRTQGEPLLNGPSPDPASAAGDYEIRQVELKGTLIRKKGTNDDWQEAAQVDAPVGIATIGDNETVYLVTKAVNPPHPIKTPDPHYPEAERQDKKQGTTVFRAVIDAGGRVQSLLTTREGFQGFPAAAAAAIAGWTFRPATMNGQPVPVVINIEVNFRLY